VLRRLDIDRDRATKLSVSRFVFNNTRNNLSSFRKSKEEEFFERLHINKSVRDSTRMNINLIHKKMHLSKKLNNLEVRRNSRNLDRRRQSNSSSSLSKNRNQK
jgi:hypothetical protein